MKLSKDQVPLFWSLWAKACRAQGWTKAHGLNSAAIDAKRKEFLARCGFSSLTEVDPRDGFSLVKRELLKLADHLAGALEEVQPQIESGRTARWFIEHDLMPCLALYVEDAAAYVAAIATDKFRWRTRDGMARPITLDDLDDVPVIRTVRGELRESPSQLEQLKMTLAGRLSGKDGLRAKAGHSVHDMRTKAGLKCRCKACSLAKITLKTPGVVTLASDSDAVAGKQERRYDRNNAPF